ncbi:hypothetical protein BT69DRAFT_1275740, partial [Atractiella rhizophila]
MIQPSKETVDFYLGVINSCYVKGACDDYARWGFEHFLRIPVGSPTGPPTISTSITAGTSSTSRSSRSTSPRSPPSSASSEERQTFLEQEIIFQGQADEDSNANSEERYFKDEMERAKLFERLLSRDADLAIRGERLPYISDNIILEVLKADPSIPASMFATWPGKDAVPRPQSLKEHHRLVWATSLVIERMTCVCVYTARQLPPLTAFHLLSSMFNKWCDRQDWRSSTSFYHDSSLSACDTFAPPKSATTIEVVQIDPDDKEQVVEESSKKEYDSHRPPEFHQSPTLRRTQEWGDESLSVTVDDLARTAVSIFYMFSCLTDVLLLASQGSEASPVLERMRGLHDKMKIKVDGMVHAVAAYLTWGTKMRDHLPMFHLRQVWWKSFEFLPRGFVYIRDYLIDAHDSVFEKRMEQGNTLKLLARRFSWEGGVNLERLKMVNEALEDVRTRREQVILLKKSLIPQWEEPPLETQWKMFMVSL